MIRPPWPWALRWAFSIGSFSRVSRPKVRSACKSTLRRRSTGSSLSLLQATWVGASGKGVLPAVAKALSSLLLTSAWRAAVALAAASLLAGM
ncbi:hypothetical protein D3C77_547700 [compost metagenome]